MRLCVVGAGYVGLTTAAGLASIGHEVVCIDSDQKKITRLKEGHIPIYEERLAEVIDTARKSGHLDFSNDGAAALRHSEAIFICVGTPPDADGKANMAAVESVARQIAQTCQGNKLVVGKSTVPVHTGDHIRRILSTYGHPGSSFEVASNPEFLREGTGVYDFYHPDRVVIGADEETARTKLRTVYSPVLDGKFHCGWHDRPASQCGWKAPTWVATTIRSAELIKHASNSFLSMKISYANAIADVCELAGAQADEVLFGLGLDHRVGADFLRPGIGFGGFCFPKDLSAFIEMTSELGYDFQLLREVQAINAQRIDHFLRKVKTHLWVLQEKTIGVLGLAFKAGTDDTRLSPAIAVVRELLRLGAKVRAYDPQAVERARVELTGEISYCECTEEVAEKADALLILTEWPEFRTADWKAMGSKMARRLVLDGRNIFKPGELERMGFEYHSIGRGVAPAQAHQNTAAD